MTNVVFTYFLNVILTKEAIKEGFIYRVYYVKKDSEHRRKIDYLDWTSADYPDGQKKLSAWQDL